MDKTAAWSSSFVGVLLMAGIIIIIVWASITIALDVAMRPANDVSVIALQNGNNFIVIYLGGPDDASLLELNVTFHKNETSFCFNKEGLSTSKCTKPAINMVMTSSGATSEDDNVLVTGLFMDGTTEVILDTNV